MLYIADGDFGLEIWDVSDIYNTVRISRYSTLYMALDLYLAQSNNLLYLSDGVYTWYLTTSDNSHGFFRIIDVSDTYTPVKVGKDSLLSPSGFLFLKIMHMLLN